MQNEDAGPAAGFVYMQTNEPERNRLLASGGPATER